MRNGSFEFVGFIPDLLDRLSRLIGFNYEIREVRDGRYGIRQINGTWNGMIGELTRGVRYVCTFYELVTLYSHYYALDLPNCLNILYQKGT